MAEPAPSAPPWLGWLPRALLVFFAYGLSGLYGLSFATWSDQVTLIWPPTGIALFALLIWGPRLWPAIGLSALLINLAMGSSPLGALVIAVGNTAGPVLAAWLLQRLDFDPRFHAARDVLLFAGVGALAGMAVNASLGTLSLVLDGTLPWTVSGWVWLTWWLGDALGVLVVGPALLALAHRSEGPGTGRTETLLAWAGLAVVSGLTLTPLSPLPDGLPTFLNLPFIIWLAMRQRPAHAAWGTLYLAALAVWSVTIGFGPFVDAAGQLEMVRLWSFMFILAIASLLITTLRGELTRALVESRAGEARLREAERVARLGSWELDLASGRLTWSPEIYRIFELDPARFQPSYENFLAVIHPDDRERVNQAYNQSLARREPYSITHRLRMPDGRVKHVHEQGRTDYGADGAALRTLGTVQDITDLEEARLALARTEAAWTEAMNHFADPLYLLDSERRLVRGNRAFYTLFDGDSAAWVGYPIEALMHPAGDATTCPICQAERDRRDARLTLEGGAPGNPTDLPIEVNVQVLRDGDDQVTGLLVNLHDLSRERALRAELVESEAKFRTFADFTYDWEVWVGPDGQYRYITPACERVTGYTVAEFMTRPCLMLDLIHPDDQPSARGHFCDFDRIEDDKTTLEFRIRRKDGEERWIEHVCQTVHEAGQYLGRRASNRDITERKAAEAELESHRRHLEELVAARTAELARARDQAEAANRSKSVFLANMSHELRTPLNAILGFAQLMARDDSLSAEQRGTLATINRSGRHLLDLINDVLEISRIEAGRAAVQNAPFDLDDSLRAIEEMARVRADAKGLDFTVERIGALPRHVEGDAPRLRQILLNLLSNAIKYTEHGEVRLRIATTGPDRLRFEVSDTGPGIAEAEHERVFQAFYQTALGEAKGEGTGLGLPISREYARMMGGHLGLVSQPGQGSTFYCELPLPPVTSADIDAPVNFHVARLRPGQAPVDVLVVEDNPDNRELLIRMLRQVGFNVRAAPDGARGVAECEAKRPNFIWMDMRMPGVDGYEATRRIRALPGGGEIRIAALTASAFRENRADILAAGCDDMVAKPLDAAHIFETMARLLGVEYEYEQPARAEAAETLADTAPPPPLPDDLVRELRAAAEALDTEATRALADHLASHDPQAAATVRRLLEEFRFEALLAWLARVPPSSHPGAGLKRP